MCRLGIAGWLTCLWRQGVAAKRLVSRADPMRFVRFNVAMSLSQGFTVFHPFEKRRAAKDKARRVAGMDASQFDARAGCPVGEP
ncbi:hypothetical protein UU5_00850, partial [Rhodanobacter sp. 115]